MAQIEQDAERLPGDEDGIASIKRIRQKQCAATDGEQPEGEWNDAAPRALGGNPLHQEPPGEQRLREKAEQCPRVEMDDEDVEKVPEDRAGQVNQHLRLTFDDGLVCYVFDAFARTGMLLAPLPRAPTRTRCSEA